MADSLSTEDKKTLRPGIHRVAAKKMLWLSDLGSQYKVEKNEDWGDCQGIEKSYGQMIRVQNSRETIRKETSPITGLPHDQHYTASYLYKYSETQLGLYTKDHQRQWKDLAKITGEDFSQGFDRHEEIFIFPIEKFKDIASVLKFREKRKVTEEQKEQLRLRMKEVRANRLEVQSKNPSKRDVSLNTHFNDSKGEGENYVHRSNE